MGRRWRRPTKHLKRQWEQPRRERCYNHGPISYEMLTEPGVLDLLIKWSDGQREHSCQKHVNFKAGSMLITNSEQSAGGIYRYAQNYVWSFSAQEWLPVRDGKVSEDPSQQCKITRCRHNAQQDTG